MDCIVIVVIILLIIIGVCFGIFIASLVHNNGKLSGGILPKYDGILHMREVTGEFKIKADSIALHVDILSDIMTHDLAQKLLLYSAKNTPDNNDMYSIYRKIYSREVEMCTAFVDSILINTLHSVNGLSELIVSIAHMVKSVYDCGRCIYPLFYTGLLREDTHEWTAIMCDKGDYDTIEPYATHTKKYAEYTDIPVDEAELIGNIIGAYNDASQQTINEDIPLFSVRCRFSADTEKTDKLSEQYKNVYTVQTPNTESKSGVDIKNSFNNNEHTDVTIAQMGFAKIFYCSVDCPGAYTNSDESAHGVDIFWAIVEDYYNIYETGEICTGTNIWRYADIVSDLINVSMAAGACASDYSITNVGIGIGTRKKEYNEEEEEEENIDAGPVQHFILCEFNVVSYVMGCLDKKVIDTIGTLSFSKYIMACINVFIDIHIIYDYMETENKHVDSLQSYESAKQHFSANKIGFDDMFNWSSQLIYDMFDKDNISLTGIVRLIYVLSALATNRIDRSVIKEHISDKSILNVLYDAFPKADGTNNEYPNGVLVNRILRQNVCVFNCAKTNLNAFEVYNNRNVLARHRISCGIIECKNQSAIINVMFVSLLNKSDESFLGETNINDLVDKLNIRRETKDRYNNTTYKAHVAVEYDPNEQLVHTYRLVTKSVCLATIDDGLFEIKFQNAISITNISDAINWHEKFYDMFADGHTYDEMNNIMQNIRSLNVTLNEGAVYTVLASIQDIIQCHTCKLVDFLNGNIINNNNMLKMRISGIPRSIPFYTVICTALDLINTDTGINDGVISHTFKAIVHMKICAGVELVLQQQVMDPYLRSLLLISLINIYINIHAYYNACVKGLDDHTLYDTTIYGTTFAMLENDSDKKASILMRAMLNIMVNDIKYITNIAEFNPYESMFTRVTTNHMRTVCKIPNHEEDFKKIMQHVYIISHMTDESLNGFTADMFNRCIDLDNAKWVQQLFTCDNNEYVIVDGVKTEENIGFMGSPRGLTKACDFSMDKIIRENTERLEYLSNKCNYHAVTTDTRLLYILFTSLIIHRLTQFGNGKIYNNIISDNITTIYPLFTNYINILGVKGTGAYTWGSYLSNYIYKNDHTFPRLDTTRRHLVSDKHCYENTMLKINIVFVLCGLINTLSDTTKTRFEADGDFNIKMQIDACYTQGV